MKRALKLSLLWLGIVAAFTFYGYFICGDSEIRSQANYGPRFTLECRTENAVLWGGFGLGLATWFALGLLTVSLVRRRQLKWGWAVLLLAASAIASTVLAAAAMVIAQYTVPVWIRYDKWNMSTLFMTVFILRMAAVGFVVLSICVLIARIRRKNETNVLVDRAALDAASDLWLRIEHQKTGANEGK